MDRNVNNPVNKIRLVCKLRDRVEVRDEELLSKLLPEGWRVEGRVAQFDGSIVKLLGLNPSRDEFMLSLSLKKSEHLEDLVRSIIRDCWYIDIYYNFRGDEARKAAEALGMTFEEKGTFEVKLFGVDLKISAYPSHKALTISYRVGWAEVSKGAVLKIHEKLCGAPKSSILSRIMGWGR